MLAGSCSSTPQLAGTRRTGLGTRTAPRTPLPKAPRSGRLSSADYLLPRCSQGSIRPPPTAVCMRQDSKARPRRPSCAAGRRPQRSVEARGSWPAVERDSRPGWPVVCGTPRPRISAGLSRWSRVERSSQYWGSAISSSAVTSWSRHLISFLLTRRVDRARRDPETVLLSHRLHSCWTRLPHAAKAPGSRPDRAVAVIATVGEDGRGWRLGEVPAGAWRHHQRV